MGAEPKRTYLVVVDDSAEARVALRFAARRAAKTGGLVEVLGIVEAQDFVQFGGVQAAIEEEQRLRIEGVVSAAIGEILDKSGIEANIIIRQGEVVKSVREYVAGRDEIAALVLGRGAERFTGPVGGQFHRKRCRPAPVPGDDHPRLAHRRAARTAELKNLCEDFGEADAAGLVFLCESRVLRAVEVEHAEQLAVADDRDHDLAIRRGVAGDVAGEGVDVFDPLHLASLGGNAADALAEFDADAGRPALERPHDQLAADITVEAGPVEVGQRFPDQRRGIGHVGDRVLLAGRKALER